MRDVKELKGTKTEANLEAAFAGESQARNNYTFFASKARKDGYVQIAKIFEETAANEKEHAELWYKLLNGGQVGTTEENLQKSANGERYEWTDMYARMAKEAKIEKEHEERYEKLLENIKTGKVFARQEEQVWQCSNCGHIHVGKEAPMACPVCKHPRAYFQIKAENY